MESGYKWRVMVLCLEGGGVKGFSSLLMLRKLMDKIAEIEKQTSLPKGININASDWEPHFSSYSPILEEFDPEPPRLPTHNSSFMRGTRHNTATFPPLATKDALRQEMTKQRGKYLPCHYFDYIGGTSTGGLTALMLGRLRLEVRECVAHYQDMSQQVFGPWRLSFKGVLRPRYSSKPLVKEIQNLVEATLPVDDDASRCRKLAAPDDLCKTSSVVFAVLEDREGPYLFRTYKNEEVVGSVPENDGPPQDCEIWEAARATSAAPRYLKPISIGKKDQNGFPGVKRPVFVDGAMACNDPTPQLIKEIQTHRRWHKGEELGVGLVLTLGTGYKPTTKAKARGLVANHLRRLASTFKTHLLRPGKAERRMRRYAKDYDFSYLKWHGGPQIEAVSLDDCRAKTFKKMAEWTEDYMNQPEIIGRSENEGDLWKVATTLVEERRKRLLKTGKEWERFASCNTYRCPLTTCTEKPNIFDSWKSAEDHIAHHHHDWKGFQTYIEVVSPCLRGPWCHDAPSL